MQVVDIFVKHGRDEFTDALSKLISTCLALPEGKLISAKSKMKMLRIHESLAEKKAGGGKAGQPSLPPAQSSLRFAVYDVDAATREATVVPEGDEGSVIERVRVPPELLGALLGALAEAEAGAGAGAGAEEAGAVYCSLAGLETGRPVVTALL